MLPAQLVELGVLFFLCWRMHLDILYMNLAGILHFDWFLSRKKRY